LTSLRNKFYGEKGINDNPNQVDQKEKTWKSQPKLLQVRTVSRRRKISLRKKGLKWWL
jgi:hypothetical protein